MPADSPTSTGEQEVIQKSVSTNSLNRDLFNNGSEEITGQTFAAAPPINLNHDGLSRNWKHLFKAAATSYWLKVSGKSSRINRITTTDVFITFI